MASKTLTAKVKIDTKSAEASLNRLANKIKAVTTAMNKTASGNNKLNTAINKAVTATNKLDSATKKVATTTDKVANTAKKINTANEQATNSARKLTSAYKSGNSAASGLLNTVKRLASTYLGIMGGKALVGASDTITSAENRLNNLEGGSPELTAQTLDKIYAASMRSRTGYGDMLGNVSKSMTLAGDAFQGNIDNAIRFQEIMAKSYALGGASAAEQASSMYQMVQALGAGVLQGDELRSVREGAPLAYQAIEKFAQGVFNTDESLKELASQGLITSDMIVAAIMDMENGANNINDKFNKTATTFGQAWTMVKNMAMQAFKPVLQMMNDALNSKTGQAFIQGIGNALVVLANILGWVMQLFGAFFSWCAKNWSWLKWIIIAVMAALIAYLIYYIYTSIKKTIIAIQGWIAEHTTMLGVLIVIGLLVAGILWLANTTASGCEFMVYALLLVAAAMIIIGLITGNTALIIIGIVLILAAVFIAFAQQIVGAIYWVGAVCANIGLAVANFFIALWNSLCAIWNNICSFFVNLWNGVTGAIGAMFSNCVAFIVNLAMGLWNAICAIATNIGIAFENAWIGAQNMFWGFIEAVLRGLNVIIKPISWLAELFGASGFSLDATIDSVAGKQQSYKSYKSVGDAWDAGWNTKSYKSVGDAWSSGWNSTSYESVGAAWNSGIGTYDYYNLGDAYDAGAQVGAGIQDTVGGWGDSIKNTLSGISMDNMLGGTDLGSLTGTGGSGLLDPNDPAYALGGAYDPSAINDDIANADKKLGNIDENTGSMADSMGLMEEDLEYLRKLANTEWKKEYTTANITVDMTNYNTVNGEDDLDGIVVRLSDKLREELNVFADGVYA